MTSFSEQMKKYRHAKGMTQQELADLLGVSNKSVSRWESDGGYPDVTMLVPLARALGVTVDDLLDTQRPVRTLTKTDWQSLLSFAFALGGGVLFYLFDLFMPILLCYLAYLGCMAYGVYLQKYYAYQSRWFFLSNTGMDLAVNFSLVSRLFSTLLAAIVGQGINITMYNYQDTAIRLASWIVGHQVLLWVLLLLAAAAVTAGTQHIVVHWSRGELKRTDLPRYRLSPGLPRPRKRLLLPLLPAAQLVLWVSYSGEDGLPVWAARYQDMMFLALFLLSALICVLLFRKKGERRWMAWGLVLLLLCAAARPLFAVKKLLNVRNGMVFNYREVSGDAMLPFEAWRPELLIFLAVLTVLALVSCFVHLKKVEKPAPSEENGETEE